MQLGERQEAVIVHECRESGERAGRRRPGRTTTALTPTRRRTSTCCSTITHVRGHWNSRTSASERRRGGGRRRDSDRHGLGRLRERRHSYSGVQLEAHLLVQELEQLAGARAAPRLQRLAVYECARPAPADVTVTS